MSIGGATGLAWPMVGERSKKAYGSPELAPSAQPSCTPRRRKDSRRSAMAPAATPTSSIVSMDASRPTTRSTRRRIASPMRRAAKRCGVSSAVIAAPNSSCGVLNSDAKIHNQGGVIGGKLALAGVAVDQPPLHVLGQGLAHQHEVDAHA